MVNKRIGTVLCMLLLALLLPACALGDYSMPVRDGDLSVYEGLDRNVYDHFAMKWIANPPISSLT